MLQPFLSRAILICLSGTIAVLSVACSTGKQKTGILRNQQSLVTEDLSVPAPDEPQAVPTISASTDLPPSPMEPSSFEMGLDKATGALSISQSAQSPDDWYLVASQFHDAIALMKQVEKQSPEFAIAQTKISEYQRQMKNAVRQANTIAQPLLTKPTPKRVAVATPQPSTSPQFVIPVPPPNSTQLTPEPANFPISAALTSEQDVFVAPIKRRIGGTPIVTVTFNGQQQFDMIVDTGASGTVITQQMANALRVVTVGKAKANTASAKAVEFPIGYVDSMAVGGVIVNRVPVAIAGAELETGLLGHDFFGNYDVTIRRNVVEFRRQSHSEINSPESVPIVPILPKQYQSVGSP
ncbi:retropepsin-like aspartic protease family protein [Anabaena subtropica]|uniref:Retroviral-like aspartic protease family protein n=1 Tax=Anabaena subtropica FACHB-260 TaxID=2692884 RepID=A0ABR8CQI5_9NOST|nr:retropepsin-like aspartic protease [Anabaena subtropica]MBD2345460.1 retroviral-like aspartic protease family protein [Anabaena subtropica FACHB-260]